MPSRRPPEGAGYQLGLGGQAWQRAVAHHQRLPPETKLIGLRQVDGMAQRSRVKGSETPQSARGTSGHRTAIRDGTDAQAGRPAPTLCVSPNSRPNRNPLSMPQLPTSGQAGLTWTAGPTNMQTHDFFAGLAADRDQYVGSLGGDVRNLGAQYFASRS